MPEQARFLLGRVSQEVEDPLVRRNTIELIKTLVVYKFSDRTTEEIETMLGLAELKQTRVYQDALQEGRQEGEQVGLERGRHQGKLAAVAPMLTLSASVEQIAQSLDLTVEEVRQAAIPALLKSDLGIEQIAKRLGIELEALRHQAVHLMLDKKASAKEIAARLEMTLPAVRRIAKQDR